MGKAILVMDMPENCVDCKLRRNGYCEPHSWNNAICGVYNNLKNNSKPDWCPLRPMPEKKERLNVPNNYDGGYSHGYVGGWNACIDAISGKTD